MIIESARGAIKSSKPSRMLRWVSFSFHGEGLLRKSSRATRTCSLCFISKRLYPRVEVSQVNREVEGDRKGEPPWRRRLVAISHMSFSEIMSAPQHHIKSKISTFAGGLSSIYVYVTQMGNLGAPLGAWNETRVSLLIAEIARNKTSR